MALMDDSAQEGEGLVHVVALVLLGCAAKELLKVLPVLDLGLRLTGTPVGIHRIAETRGWLWGVLEDVVAVGVVAGEWLVVGGIV